MAPKTTISFLVDLIGSTKAGLGMHEEGFRRYNRAIIKQIWPHVRGLELDTSIIKFTGDGWLLFNSDLEKAKAVVALAKIMATTFQHDLATALRISTLDVPALKLAICTGDDEEVKLETGAKDWVGDSARRASRALQLCFQPNQLIVDYTIYVKIQRAFDTKQIILTDIPEDVRPKKWEEDFPVYSVGELRDGFENELHSAEDPTSYAPYVIFLKAKGQIKQAESAIRTISDVLIAENKVALELPASAPSKVAALTELASEMRKLLYAAPTAAMRNEIVHRMKNFDISLTSRNYNNLINRAVNYVDVLDWFDRMLKEKVTPNEVTYNTLVNRSPDYDTAKGWFDRMLKEKVTPDEVTYSTLINLSPDYDTAKGWFDRMLKEKVTPDEVTYSTLINLSPDYDTAKGWFDRMLKEKVTPNEVTYSTLINLSPDYDTAKGWFDRMLKEKVTPNEVTYSTLINLSPDYDTAKGWFDRMLKEKVTPNEVTYNTLINLSPDYDTAKGWFDRMLKEKVTPNEVTYNTLINLSPDYDTAKGWFDRMLKEKVTPDEVTYSTLIDHSPDYETASRHYENMLNNEIEPSELTHTALLNKAPDFSSGLKLTIRLSQDKRFLGYGYFGALFAKDILHLSGEELLDIYHSLPVHHERGLEPAILSYRKAKKFQDAYRICLFAPHLEAAKALYRQKGDESAAYFEGAIRNNLDTSNALYALGICLFENKKFEEAKLYLIKARELAYAEQRIKNIDQMLYIISSQTH